LLQKKYYFLLIFIIIASKLFPIDLIVGETLVYEIRVLGVKAGKQITYVKSLEKLSNTMTYHVYSKTSSTGWVRSIYVLDDIYDAWIDTNTLLPLKLKRDLTEGKWKYKSTIFLDQTNKFAKIYINTAKKPRIIKIKKNTIDILSMIYYFRNIDLKVNKKPKLFLYHYKKIKKFNPIIKKGPKYRNKWIKNKVKYYKSFEIKDKFITKVKIYILPEFNFIPVQVVIPVLKVGSWGTIDVSGTLKKYFIKKYK